jgi:hypothetical protein
MPRAVAAGYLSRYAGDSRQLSEAAALKERPRRLLYVARSLTAVSFCTMRRLRRVRYLWVLRTMPTSAVFSVARLGHRPRWLSDGVEARRVLALAGIP